MDMTVIWYQGVQRSSITPRGGWNRPFRTLPPLQSSRKRWRCPARSKRRKAATCCCASGTSNLLSIIDLAVMVLSVTVWAQSNRVRHRIFTAVGQSLFVVNLQVRRTVFGLVERRWLCTLLANPVRLPEHFSDNIWVSPEKRYLCLIAFGSSPCHSSRRRHPT